MSSVIDLAKRAAEITARYYDGVYTEEHFFQTGFAYEAAKILSQLIGGNGRVLDLGCAVAQHGPTWTDHFGCDYVGVDVSPRLVKHVATYPDPYNKMDVRCAPLHDLSCLAGERFNAVWTSHVFEFIPSAVMPMVLEQVRALMTPDGYWTVVGHNASTDTKEGFVDNEYGHHYFSPKSFSFWSDLFAKHGFRVHLGCDCYAGNNFWLMVQPN